MGCPLESAIPTSLQCPRTIPSKHSTLPPNFTPPFSAYTSRFPSSASEVVFAIIGAQYPSESADNGVGITTLLNFVKSNQCPGPAHFDIASVTDSTGAYNISIHIYFPSVSAYTTWSTRSGFKTWWNDGLDAASEECGCGWFLEVLTPTMERLENVTSGSDIQEGIGYMQEKISGEIKEHGYWGSMRDRLAIAQTDPLQGERAVPSADEGLNGDLVEGNKRKKRVRVPGQKNLCVIRSGQDWSGTRPEERTLYLESMHPVLLKGMEFLARDGQEVGCYSCRLMEILDPETRAAETDKTFGLAYFQELASLEGWAWKHKTHLNIFGRFIKYTKELGNDISLKLWHDVFVLEEGQQYFEYMGCHGETGMLGILE